MFCFLFLTIHSYSAWLAQIYAQTTANASQPVRSLSLSVSLHSATSNEPRHNRLVKSTWWIVHSSHPCSSSLGKKGVYPFFCQDADETLRRAFFQKKHLVFLPPFSYLGSRGGGRRGVMSDLGPLINVARRRARTEFVEKTSNWHTAFSKIVFIFSIFQ